MCYPATIEAAAHEETTTTTTTTNNNNNNMQEASSSSSSSSKRRLLPAFHQEETPKRVKTTQTTTPKIVGGVRVVHDDDNNKANAVNAVVVVTPKRQGYLSWDDYFLAVTSLSSKRSKDPKSPSGACIVDSQNRIVGIGYNGLPRGCPDDVFPWRTDVAHKAAATATNDDDDYSNPFVCPAVTNAILNKCSDTVEKCRIYVGRFPSSDCAKVIIQSRIEEVVILETSTTTSSNNNNNDTDVQASRIMLQMAGVNVRYCKPSVSNITLDFVQALTPTTLEEEEEDNNVHPNNKTYDDDDENKKDPAKQKAIRLLLEEANYDATKHDSGKRTTTTDGGDDGGDGGSIIHWQDYFMAMAFLTAQRSKDPNTQVGACIVDQSKRIIGLGYNGFPRGCHDDCLPWARAPTNHPLHNKYLYVCHAEVNAILNKGSANVKGASIYVALFPCQNCAKMIIQSGIQEVIYMADSYHDTPSCRASRIMLQCANVKLRHYIPTMQRMVLTF